MIDKDVEPTPLHPSIHIPTGVVNPPQTHGSQSFNGPSEPTAMYQPNLRKCSVRTQYNVTTEPKEM